MAEGRKPPQDYHTLFNKFDVAHSGVITLKDFKNAVDALKHPVASSPELVEKVFQSFDYNKDKVIDLKDFERYLSSADAQILSGFEKINSKHDGRLTRADFINYLTQTLRMSPPKETIDQLFEYIDLQNHGFITYDEFREFLFLIPRIDGSRIKTALNYAAEELDLSSDGDVTLINQFLSGIGFFLAGGLSGVVSRTCTAPFDRIKVFLIARTDLSSTVLHSITQIKREVATSASRYVLEEARKRLAQAKLKQSSHVPEPPHKRTIRSPIIQAARTLWKQGGFKAFYVGNGLNVMKVFPESAMKFGSFELTKRVLARIEGVDDTSKLSRPSTYLAGGLGGVVAQLTVYPIDTLKFRLQCSNLDSLVRGNKLLIKTAKTMFEEGGFRIFYRGILVGISGIFPYAALDLGTFSTIKNRLVKRQAKIENIPEDGVKLPNYMVLTLGAISGTFGATVVYPVNLLRTRLQAQGTYAHPYRYEGFRDVLQKTIKREGYPGLFKGLVPNLAKVAPAVSISYFMYENLKRLFGLNNKLN
ncbi:mitochondrial carrier [Metschnikowia bicuspidata]|uniref:Mitochondrial carrier n=1 Tax=Metschnikowia bicuspidata TaxID=27322 RepID=A0A4P9ZE60_9ASCO|nr:mitochondrial carrier [Metschnikowia bicuspidata]